VLSSKGSFQVAHPLEIAAISISDVAAPNRRTAAPIDSSCPGAIHSPRPTVGHMTHFFNKFFYDTLVMLGMRHILLQHPHK
jgi:hypothetical protein